MKKAKWIVCSLLLAIQLIGCAGNTGSGLETESSEETDLVTDDMEALYEDLSQAGNETKENDDAGNKQTEAIVTETVRTEEEILSEDAQTRIEYYSGILFRFLEEVEVVSENGTMAVSTSFVPEVGSFVIKQDLYKAVTEHALQIIRFYPEVTRLEYTILWDDKSKEEAMTILIEGSKVTNLEYAYAMQRINENGGLDTHYEEVFTAIEETETSLAWRNAADSEN